MNIDWMVAIVSRQLYYLKANQNDIFLTLIFQLVHFSVIVLLPKKLYCGALSLASSYKVADHNCVKEETGLRTTW